MPRDYVLPEDCALQSLVIQMDLSIAKGGSGIILQVGSTCWLVVEPLPRRTLAACERLAELGTPPLEEAAIHDLVRVARTFETVVRDSASGGQYRAGHDDPTALLALKAIIPALLAIEAAVAKLDGKPAPAEGLVEIIAVEIRQVGRVYPYQERYYKVLGDLARRVLAVESRLASIESPTAKASKP